MVYLKFRIGNKKISLPKSLIKKMFPWLYKLYGINSYFEEKNELIYDIIEYLPEKADLEIISILSNIDEWIYDRREFTKIVTSENGLEAINFLKYGPSKLEDIKKWQCKKCLKIVKKKHINYTQHKLKFFGSNNCAAVCVNCGLNWRSWYNSNDPSQVFCKNISECKHQWEEI